MRDALELAAQRVVNEAETDDNFDGEYVDWLVPSDAFEALRAALAARSEAGVPLSANDIDAIAFALREVGGLEGTLSRFALAARPEAGAEGLDVAALVRRLQAPPYNWNERITHDLYAALAETGDVEAMVDDIVERYGGAMDAMAETGAEGLREAVLRAGTLLNEQHGESCDCSVCLVVQPLVDGALAETEARPDTGEVERLTGARQRGYAETEPKP